MNKKIENPLKKMTLFNRIFSIKGEFLHYVDSVTLNYFKTKHYEEHPDDDLKEYDVYEPTELSKKQKEDSIEMMKYFIKDIEQCIWHLENWK